MPEHYCETTDLLPRLTAAGFDWAINREGGQVTTSQEVTRYVVPAIQRAGAEIDSKISLRYEPSAARGNLFLKFLAVDIAAVEVCTNGGRGATDQFLASAKRARETLDQIQSGRLNVPDLDPRAVGPYVPIPYDPGGVTVVNFCDSRRT